MGLHQSKSSQPSSPEDMTDNRSGGAVTSTDEEEDGDALPKRPNWTAKISCKLKCLRGSRGEDELGAGEEGAGEVALAADECICTGYRRTEEHHLGAGVVFQANEPSSSGIRRRTPIIDLSKFNPDAYPVEDYDEVARQERAREIAEGVDLPVEVGSQPEVASPSPPPSDQFLRSPNSAMISALMANGGMNNPLLSHLTAIIHNHLTQTNLQSVDLTGCLANLRTAGPVPIHTQVDYVHCLVPDLLRITSCSFYWGKMDRYEAEKLLDRRPEGTFLLRDSAQEEYLFSVSFRRYGRSLHARIEQFNHQFSFDSHDPGVFASPTVCGLIEHYKDPSCCMFFEPMLTLPLHRDFPFSLQHLARSVICSHVDYNSVGQLQLPKSLKSYLREYHYKQRVRVRWFDPEH